MASAAFEEIIEDFEYLEDWEDRYRYVIDQGKAMDGLDDSLKVPATKVDGCASQVWLHPRITDGTFVLRMVCCNALECSSYGFYIWITDAHLYYAWYVRTTENTHGLRMVHQSLKTH